MPIRRIIVPTQLEKDARQLADEVNGNLLIIADSVLTQDTCDVIINVLEGLPISNVNLDEDTGKMESENPLDMESSWRYIHPQAQHDVAVLQQGTNQFEQVLHLVEAYMPKTQDFGEITYATIMKYPKDTHFNWHQDSADQNDTGTCIFMLNEEYEGGRLNVEGHTILPRRGTMVAFNNSTIRWHSVEPIFQGERYVFLVWFRKAEEENSDERDEMQSV